MAKGPRSRSRTCFEGRGDTVEEAVNRAVALAEKSRVRKPVVFDLQVKVLLGNPITDYIANLTPQP
jgi:hypothetical protein